MMNLNETPDFSVVTPEWLQEKLTKYRLSQTRFCELVQYDIRRLNGFLRGRNEMGRQAESAVYYFFLALES